MSFTAKIFICLILLLSLTTALLADNAEMPKLRVAAFYSSTCNNCHKAKQALKKAGELYADSVEIEHHDVADEDEFVLMFDYEDFYHGKEQAPPKVYVGTQILEGYGDIGSKLIDVIKTELKKGSVTFDPANPDITGKAHNTQKQNITASERLTLKLETFSAGAVAAAGLIDGVNPCAFTTIVFLISMLTHLGKSKRELVIVGIGFTAAVFITYMLLGIGALKLLQSIKEYSVTSGMARIITAIVGIAALAFGAWSFKDFLSFKRTKKTSSMTLGLPHSLRLKINKVIRRGLSAKSLLIGSVIVGILVALLESACTGQIYLPTIVLVLQNNKLQSNALAYLLLYNLMFIAPLIAVLLITYKGTTSQKLTKIVQQNLASAKLIIAMLFTVLGVLVLVSM